MDKSLVILFGFFVVGVLGAPVVEVGIQPPNPNNWTTQCVMGEGQLLAAVTKEFSQVSTMTSKRVLLGSLL